jgi:hypothetical protein
VGIVFAANLTSRVLLAKVGPRPIVPVGMLLAMGGMLSFTGLGLDSGYASGILPGLVVLGLGMGAVMAPSMSSATAGVDHGDSGVASAMVNTGQQVGGSIGTAFLSSIAASAVTSFVADAGAGATPAAMAEAAVHGYTTAFWWSAAIFAGGAVVSALLLQSGAAAAPTPGAEPVPAH